MKKSAVFGVGGGVNGRDAAMQATQRALDQLGATRPVLALVLISREYDPADVVSGLTGLLGDTPLWGFTTTSPLSGTGDHARSVLVALITGAELKADVKWFPAYSQDSPTAAKQLLAGLKSEVFLPQAILLAADGISGSLVPFCAALDAMQVNVAGCMAAGESSLGKTFTLAKNQAGPGALSAAVLGGSFRLGAGRGHGWQDLGIYFRATRTRDVWVQALDGLPPAETFSRYFGFSAREWAFPPLTDMARLYPLGVEPSPPEAEPKRPTGPLGSTSPLTPISTGVTGILSAPGQSGSQTTPITAGAQTGTFPIPGAGVSGTSPIPTQPPPSSPPFVETNPANLLLRSILRVEIDGSLRMSAPVPEGAVVHLMTGDLDACLVAARDAAEQALNALGGAKPLLAIAFVDVAWQSLLATRPGQLSDALNTVLGDIPLVGAYTLGQLARPDLNEPPVLRNQDALIVIIGEAQE